RTDYYCLAFTQAGNECHRGAVRLAGSALHGLSIHLIVQSMNDKGANLAEDALGYVTRALRGNADVERHLSSLFGNQLEGVQRITRIFIAQALVEKVMRLVQKHKERAVTKLPAARQAQRESPNRVRHDLPRIMREGEMLQGNAEHAGIPVG